MSTEKWAPYGATIRLADAAPVIDSAMSDFQKHWFHSIRLNLYGIDALFAVRGEESYRLPNESSHEKLKAIAAGYTIETRKVLP